MPRQENIERVAKDQLRVADAYFEVSRTDAGQVMLNDLINFCGQNRPSYCEQLPNNDQTNINEGKRRVWLRISAQIERAKDELDKRNRTV